jgi:hypothetical protein
MKNTLAALKEEKIMWEERLKKNSKDENAEWELSMVQKNI